MAPVWLNESVKHISKIIDGEDRNLIKKGWDQLYMDPIKKEGFDPLKVDIISVHEEVARGVSQAESRYHEM